MARGAAEPRTRLASLSNDCLAAILSFVPLRERVATCALVCKRWHELATAEPQLLQCLQLKVSNESKVPRPRMAPSQSAASGGEQRLCSALCFLTAAAPHVRQLDLYLDAPMHYNGEQMRQLAAELQASLGRCTQLQCLALNLCDVPCSLGPWLAPLAGSLRQLKIEYTAGKLRGHERALQLQPGGLPACTCLDALMLDSSGWLEAPSAACWPQQITSLDLHLPLASELPPSMAALGSLRRLRLVRFDGKPGTWQALSKLSALQQLEIERCEYLPAPALLAALEQLQSLELLASPADRDLLRLSDSEEEDDEEEDEADQVAPAEEVEDALAALGGRRLTHLKLAGCDYLVLPSQALSHLSSLRSFSFDSDPYGDAGLDWPTAELPPGGWHHSLTRLELPHAVLSAPAVFQVLQAATQLEELTVGRFNLPPRQPLPDALRFVSWAAALPRLKQLTVGLSEGWSEPPPGMPAQYSRSRSRGASSSMEIEPAEHLLRRQALAAMGALATAALQVQARRPGLAIGMLSEAELHPDGLGEWVPYSF